MTENIQNNDVNPQPENNNHTTPDETKSEVDLLLEKIKLLEEQASQLKDQLLRKAAEFENFKRRTENDYLLLTKYSSESMINNLLPIIDDLSRFINSHNEKEDPFYKGVELIYNKFQKILQDKGVAEMETTGKQFDVNLHDALLQQPSNDVPPNTILQEIEKGYYLHDKVIRHAKVIVSTESETK